MPQENPFINREDSVTPSNAYLTPYDLNSNQKAYESMPNVPSNDPQVCLISLIY